MEQVACQIGASPRPARRTLREFSEKANIAREEHRKKYKEKIKHLNNKYRESTDEMIRIIPTDMEELRDLRVFNPERYNKMKEEEYDLSRKLQTQKQQH